MNEERAGFRIGHKVITNKGGRSTKTGEGGRIVRFTKWGRFPAAVVDTGARKTTFLVKNLTRDRTKTRETFKLSDEIKIICLAVFWCILLFLVRVLFGWGFSYFSYLQLSWIVISGFTLKKMILMLMLLGSILILLPCIILGLHIGRHLGKNWKTRGDA